MTRAEFFDGIEKMLEVEGKKIQGDEMLESLGDWNSLSVIAFIAFADRSLGLSLSPDKLKKAERVSDLLELVKDKIKG